MKNSPASLCLNGKKNFSFKGKKDMKLALESGVFKDYPLETTLKRMREIGIGDIELASRRTYGHFEADKVDERQVSATKEILARYGIKACAVFTYGNHLLGSPDESVRKNAVNEMRAVLRNTRGLGCDLVASEMKPGRLQMALSEQREIEQCKKAWLKSIAELSGDLDQLNVRLAFEPHPGDFVEDNNVAVDLIRECENKRVGYLYCFPHTFNFTGKLSDMIEYAGATTMHVHLGDSHKVDKIVPPYVVKSSPELSLRFKREVHEHLIPGRGDVDFTEGMEALRRINYTGYLGLQPFSHNDDPVNAAAESFRYAQRLIV